MRDLKVKLERNKLTKTSKGITLIALVITIVVLLILAGVTVATLTGDNGLLTKAGNAKQTNEEATALERIQVEVAGSYGLDGKIDIVELNKNLKRINGLKYKGLDLVLDGDNKNCIEGLPANVILSDYYFIIEEKGSVTNLQPTEIIYLALYNDGTLVFSNDNEIDSNKTLLKTYTIAKDIVFETESDIPWKDERNSITSIDFKNLVIPLSTKRWFQGCTQLQNLYHMENLNTRLTRDMSFMFLNCSLLNVIDLSHISTENVTNMYAMFYNCYSLTNLDLRNFNTSSVTTMGGMFRGCMSIETLNLSMFNTSKVTDIQGMFMGCRKLSTLDLSSFDTSKVINMSGLFSGWSNMDNKTGDMKLTSVNLSSFNTSEVTLMNDMFASCSNLTSLDLSGFDTKKVTNMQSMFANCSKLQHIYVGDDWDISNVNNTTNMYKKCTARPEKK